MIRRLVKHLFIATCAAMTVALMACNYTEPSEGGMGSLEQFESKDEVPELDGAGEVYDYLDNVTLEYGNISISPYVISDNKQVSEAEASGSCHGVAMSVGMTGGSAEDTAQGLAGSVSAKITAEYGTDVQVEYSPMEWVGDTCILQGSFSIAEGGNIYPGMAIIESIPLPDNTSFYVTIVVDNKKADGETEDVLLETMEVCGLSVG